MGQGTEEGGRGMKSAQVRHFEAHARSQLLRVLQFRRKGRHTGKPRGEWSTYFDFSPEEFLAQVEASFCDGMTFGNYGEWYLAHKVAPSNYPYEQPGEEGWRKAWALTNLVAMRPTDVANRPRKVACQPLSVPTAGNCDQLFNWEASLGSKKLPQPMRNRLDGIAQGQLTKAVKGQPVDPNAWRLLFPGFTPEQFCAHMTSLFVKGMRLQNHGRWHIDHVLPRAAFDYSDPRELSFRACWSLVNLRPLWGRDNLIKAAIPERASVSYAAASG